MVLSYKMQKMSKDSFTEILNKYLEGKASEEEVKEFESFFESFQNSNKSWEDYGLSDKEKIRLEIYQNMQPNISKPSKPLRRRLYKTIKIAASVAILISIGYFIFSLMEERGSKSQSQLITETTRFGEKKNIVLSDSTKITLNAGSSISYYEPFHKDKREIVLSGEAFFDVTKDSKRPFTVTSREISTTVLGTSFNIYAYEEEDINVTVTSGKVKVSYMPPDGSSINSALLSPGEQAVFDAKTRVLAKYEVDTKQYIGWQQNNLHFIQDSVSDILIKLERNYNVHFECNDSFLLNKTVTSAYENASVDEILNDLQFILGFEYSYRTNDTIVISN